MGIKNLGEESEQLKKRLSQQILDDFGIFIKWEDIPDDRNVAMRYVMKLILNSLWGKLCQNFNKSIVKFVSSAEELYDLIYDPSYDNVYFDIMDSETACVNCTYAEENNYKINKTCVALGCYVTCYARLKLLRCSNELPANSVLYYDTDSVIYFSENRYELLETHSKLGRDECIMSFVSTGPKSYTYYTNLGKEIVHVKGFKRTSIDKENRINSNYLYDLVEDIFKVYEIKKSKFTVDNTLNIKNTDNVK